MQPTHSSKPGLLNQHQQGFILVAALLLLSILSFSALLAMERSQFSLKVNKSRLAHIEARHHAETARLKAVALLEASLAEQNNQNLPVLINVVNQARNQSSRFDKEGLPLFVTFNQADLRAEVFVQPLPTRLSTQGVSLTENMAYQGLGKGLGQQGSFSKFYEVRAKGLTRDRQGSLAYWSASDYRFVP